jgi:NitT/TauT family transport system permease protein
VARALSVAALIALWAIAAVLAHSRLLPSPLDVAETIVADVKSGELPLEIGYTLARVVASFTIALVLGSIAGYAMGHFRAIDRYADPWLIALINLPALVTIIFAYVWIGLNETAAILAVALNKLPMSSS